MIVIFTVFPIIIWPCPNGLKYARGGRKYLTFWIVT